MSSDSESNVTNISENVNFNNLDYGGGGGGGNIADNFNLNRSSLEIGDVSVSETDHGAVAAGRDIAEASIVQQGQALALAYDDTEDSREFAEGVFIKSTDAVTDSNRSALQMIGQSTDRALAFAKQATRSEAGQIAENLTKYMMIGGAGIVILVIVMGRK